MKTKRIASKGKLQKIWFSNFSANILGVIIGIALTFGISSYIQQREEKKQVREMMLLIKQELNDNKKWLASREREYKNDFNAYWTVLRNDGLKIPEDTLQAHIAQMRRNNIKVTGSNVWNVFQNSGMIQKLHNPDLVARLSECYLWMDETKAMWKEYGQRKEVLSDVFEVRYVFHPDEYINVLKENKDTRRFLENMGRFNYYNFTHFNEVLSPYIDYALFSVENYDNPKKIAIDYDAYCEMQKIKTQNK